MNGNDDEDGDGGNSVDGDKDCDGDVGEEGGDVNGVTGDKDEDGDGGNSGVNGWSRHRSNVGRTSPYRILPFTTIL